MQIAVIDNDTSLLRSLGIILKRQGHTVQYFEDPKEALAMVSASWQPDVIFVDLVMPSMSGLELLSSAAPHLGASCRKAIITGHAEQLNEADLVTAGVDALFAKPLDVRKVREFAGRAPIRHDAKCL